MASPESCIDSPLALWYTGCMILQPEYLQALTEYSEISGTPVDALVNEALSDYITTTLAARMEYLQESSTIES
jgi:hypothetical protein